MDAATLRALRPVPLGLDFSSACCLVASMKTAACCSFSIIQFACLTATQSGLSQDSMVGWISAATAAMVAALESNDMDLVSSATTMGGMDVGDAALLICFASLTTLFWTLIALMS